LNAADVIREARRKTDDWVLTKPPVSGFRREYELPGDLNLLPDQVSRLLDKAFPPWRSGKASTFEVATPQDAQLLDAAIFDERRQALLDTADHLLDDLIR